MKRLASVGLRPNTTRKGGDNLKAVAERDLRSKVRVAYSEAAEQPEARHPFPIGRAFAESLGYPQEWLDDIPLSAVAAFAGVANVPCFAHTKESATVLDLGCGAGLDSLLVARRVARRGKVVGLDFSWSMLHRARCAAFESATANVVFCQADAERLPLPDAAVDAAITNGIFNLNPDRAFILRELARCIRVGGQLYAAELIVREPLPASVTAGDDNWFS